MRSGGERLFQQQLGPRPYAGFVLPENPAGNGCIRASGLFTAHIRFPVMAKSREGVEWPRLPMMSNKTFSG
jgi:hypothetical protein